MSVPDDLKLDPTLRGPVGAELMGVSIALPAQLATYDDGTPWDRDGWVAAVNHYQPQLLETLRRHVGGAQPVTEPQMNLDGPHSDPLQGPIYVMTAAAWFMPGSLAIDCPAYKARSVRHG
jgi:hypothetical protein